MNDSNDFAKEFAEAKKYAGSTVVLVCSTGHDLDQLRQLVAARADMAHVKIVAKSELDGLDGHTPTHFEVDEVGHISDAIEAAMLMKMRERSAEDFKREMMCMPVAGDKIEQEMHSERRGKWKGRRAIERGWRR